MVKVKNKLEMMIDPAQPVKEACEVISVLVQMHPKSQKEILTGIRNACEKQLVALAETKPNDEKSDDA